MTLAAIALASCFTAYAAPSGSSAKALLAAGREQLRLGQVYEGIRLFEDGRDLAARSQDQPLAALAEVELAKSYFYLGDFARSFKHLPSASADVKAGLAAHTPYPAPLLRALITGPTERSQPRKEEPPPTDRIEAGRKELLRGLVEPSRESRHAHLLRAVAALRASDDRYSLAWALFRLARFYSESDLFPEALAAVSDAEKLGSELPADYARSLALAERARIAWALGRFKDALVSGRESVVLARKHDYADLEADGLEVSGIAARERGELEDSLRSLKAAVRIRRDQGARRQDLERLSMELARAGRLQAQRLRKPFSPTPDAWNEGPTIAPTTPLVRAHGYLLSGQHAAALNIYDLEFSTGRSCRDPSAIFAADVGAGLAYERIGQPAKAYRFFQRAVLLSEASRALTPLSERTHFLAARDFGFSRLDAAEGLVRTTGRRAAGENAAFQAAEATRARQFSEMVARRRLWDKLAVPADLAADIDRRVASLQESQRALVLGCGATGVEEPTALEASVKNAEANLETGLAMLRSRHPAYAAIAYPRPVSTAELRLAPDEVLIEFEVTEPYTVAFVLKDGRVVQMEKIDVTRRDLSELVAAFRAAFEGVSQTQDLDRFDPELAYRLYALLLKPLLETSTGASRIPPQARLIIVPDEMLALLPFESLAVSLDAAWSRPAGPHGPVPMGVRYLGDTRDVAYAQSATALMIQRELSPYRTPAASGALVFADPVFDGTDPRLRPFAASSKAGLRAERGGEVKSMGVVGRPRASSGDRTVGAPGDIRFPRLAQTSLLAESLRSRAFWTGESIVRLGLEASERAVRTMDLSRFRYLVIATHGLLDGEAAGVHEPALVMSQVGTDREFDGFLTMSEAMGLHGAFEVVALTACNTGVGEGATGEGVLGLGRAFQAAGADSVLISLWPVAEEASTGLVDEFFRLLASGSSKRAALQGARAKVRRLGYEHPFYWASMVLVGS